MSKDEQYSYIVLLVASILFLIWIVPSQIDVGENASVSPRLVPQILAAGIGFISALQLVRTFLDKDLVKPEFTINAASYRALAIVTAILFAIAFFSNLLPTIVLGGFAIGRFWLGAIILVPAMLYLAGVRDRRTIVKYTLVLVGLSYLFTVITGIYIA